MKLINLMLTAISVGAVVACGGGGGGDGGDDPTSASSASSNLASYAGIWSECIPNPSSYGEYSARNENRYTALSDNQLVLSKRALFFYNGRTCAGDPVAQITAAYASAPSLVRRDAQFTAQRVDVNGAPQGETTVDVFDTKTPAYTVSAIGTGVQYDADSALDRITIEFADGSFTSTLIGAVASTTSVRYRNINDDQQFLTYSYDTANKWLMGPESTYTQQAALTPLNAMQAVTTDQLTGTWLTECNPSSYGFSGRFVYATVATSSNTADITKEEVQYFASTDCTGDVYASITSNYDSPPTLTIAPAQRIAAAVDENDQDIGVQTAAIAREIYPSGSHTYSANFVDNNNGSATVTFPNNAKLTSFRSISPNSYTWYINLNDQGQAILYDPWTNDYTKLQVARRYTRQ